MIVSVSIKKALPVKGEALCLFVFEDSKQQDSPIEKKLLPKFKKQLFKGTQEQIISFENVEGYEYVFVAGLGKKAQFSPVILRNALASIVRRANNAKVQTLWLLPPNIVFADAFVLGENIALGTHLGNYQFLKYKERKSREKLSQLKELVIVYSGQANNLQTGTERGTLFAQGVCLTRDLVNDPASHVHPQTLVDVAKNIQKQSPQISVEVLEEEDCRKLGMGAFLGVAQGSDRKAKFIVLHYEPASSTSEESLRNTSEVRNKVKKVALVGKSITFDSGGLSLKPSNAMEDMKIDMAGGATVLGVFHVLGKIGAPVEVYGILPACENMPSGKAMRPGDIVTALNGKTIEVLNTDAEGRLTLADALVYAEKYLKADVIIDLATLTGACMIALGNDLAGLFSNNDRLQHDFESVAQNQGDELWPLPLYQSYLKKMKSDTADLKNISGGRQGGAITAALFLSEFVEKSPWIHLDIAGPAYRSEEPKGAIGKGGTGWGVLSLISWISKMQ